MRYYPATKGFYCGVDLHARNMYACIVSKPGEKLVHRKLRNDAETFLRIIEPYKPDLVVSAESTSSWYWLADLCEDNGVEFALGHALYMKAIHGAKAKNDRIDCEKIARLTQSGLLPYAYVYPRPLRALRDLLRRRLKFARARAGVMAHIKSLNGQWNLPSIGYDARYKSTRPALPGRFEDADMRKSAEADVEMIDYYDARIRDLEKYILARAKGVRPKELSILTSAPGIGKIIALTIILEMDTVDRFPTRQDFASYSRLVKCKHTSAGKVRGSGGHKMGSAYLKWAFCEAAVHAGRHSDRIGNHLAKNERKYGPGKAKTLLAHKLGRAFYLMLKRGAVFDEERFLTG